MAESKYYGMYQGIVTNNNDPEKRGRIKVKCPEVLGGNTESAWCDPVVEVAYDNGGDFCIPAKEEGVWIAFLAGDANRPVYFGGWWQDKMTPLGNNYTNIDKVRIISYADCTITLKEGIININVGAGVCDLKIEHNRVTVDGNLTVKGNIDCYTLNAGDVNANAGENGGGNVRADTSISSGGISLTSHKHSGVTTGGSKTGTPTN